MVNVRNGSKAARGRFGWKQTFRLTVSPPLALFGKIVSVPPVRGLA